MNTPLSLFISALLIFLGFIASGQSDICDATSTLIVPGVITPGNNVGATADEDYSIEFVCASSDFRAQVWYQFIAGSNSAEMIFTSTGIGDASVFIVEGCGPCAGSEHVVYYICDVPSMATEIAGFCTEPGANYWIGISSDNGDEGSFNLEIDESVGLDAANSICDAATVLSDGITNVSNFCTTQKFLFFAYTVQTGPSIKISTSGNAPLIPVCSGTSIQTILPDCSNSESPVPTTIPISGCLAVGQTVFIRVQLSLEYALEIEIVDPNPDSVPAEDHDFCNTALDINNGPLLCGGSAGFIGNSAACPDLEGDGCNDSDSGIWGFFTIDPSVPFFDVEGSGFQLFEGAGCNNLTSLICDIPTNGIAPNFNSTYYVLLTGDSDSFFNVNGATNSNGTPDFGNDVCASADAISLGVNSGLTNLCSSRDINLGACSAAESESTVWYQYTPSPAVDFVEITLTAATITSPAFGIYDACGGALLDNVCSEGTLRFECDILGQYLIQVGSATADVGDFALTITEGNSNNDECDGPLIDTEIYVPNIFSPNGDLRNDEIIIHGGADVARVIDWRIYNRWGNLVYLAENFFTGDLAFAWDGKFRGDVVNPGVYVYIAEVEFVNGDTEVVKGSITLIQ